MAKQERRQGRVVACHAPSCNGQRNVTAASALSLRDQCAVRARPAVAADLDAGAIFPAVYNANTRLVPGPGFVAITYEMIHETRVIPIGDRPHVASAIRQVTLRDPSTWAARAPEIANRRY